MAKNAGNATALGAAPTTRPAGPLQGLFVLDLTRVLAGPYCTMVLGDLGARVVKVEPPAGDDARAYGPFLDKEQKHSGYFASLNRGKESIALDLKSEAGRRIFDRLIERADVLVENFRPGTMEKLGLGWEVLHARHPRLIYASASGFGHTGPYATRPAYDMVVQAMGGMMSITGEPGRPPVRVGSAIGDIVAGLFTAIGITSALTHRQTTGEAIKVDVAMLDCQVAILENAIARYAATGVSPGPLGARHPSIVPFAAFKTRDDSIIIAAGNDGLFVKLCEALGKPALAQDARFKTNPDRGKNLDALTAALEELLARHGAAHWMMLLEKAGIPCGPINSIKDVINDPQVRSRNMVVTANDPDFGPLIMAGNPIKLSNFADPATRAPAPRLDANRDSLLSELATTASPSGALVPVGTALAPVAPAPPRTGAARLLEYLAHALGVEPSVAIPRDGSFRDRAKGLADALLSERGEVLGTAIAGDLIDLVKSADASERLQFFQLLATAYNADAAAISRTADRWRSERSPTAYAELMRAVEPPRQELFRRMNMGAGGTATLIGLRQHLIATCASDPTLRPVDQDLQHLLGSWFNRGFLTLERISWQTPAAILEKLIAFEAVHAIDGWDDLRRRLGPDRRCYGFFHPALPNEPIIFVEVALLDHMAARVEPIIRAPLPAAGTDPAETADTAIFYSISNCQPGLKGISFGNFLIKQVVADLQRELPGLQTFATLSPMPLFRRWLEDKTTDLEPHLPPTLIERVAKETGLGDLRQGFELLARAGEADGYSRSNLLRDCLLRLGARYLAGAGTPGGVTDPVARFHLGNGAAIERVNWMADLTKNGRAQSHGLMVNYLYDLDAVPKNHEAFANGRPVAMSRAIAALIDVEETELLGLRTKKRPEPARRKGPTDTGSSGTAQKGAEKD